MTAGFEQAEGKHHIAMARRLSEEVLDLIFPPRCQACDAFSTTPLCVTCLADVRFIVPPMCLHCGVPLPPAQHPAMLCANCRDGQWISGARAAGLHAGALRDAIIRFKFDGRTRLIGPLADMLARVIRSEAEIGGLSLGECAALVPVPLHPGRRAWRGFDQAEMLCRAVADELCLPVWHDVLSRIRNTTPQVQLRGASRHANVRGAFEALAPGRLRGRSVILVDDVYTTGATINECASVLRRSGAAAVYGLTVSRAAPAWHAAALLDDSDASRRADPTRRGPHPAA